MSSMMMTQAEKRVLEGSLSLKKEPKRRCQDTDIDYRKCIICQGLGAKGLFNITTDKLVLAMKARQDETFERLKHDLATGTWLTDKIPKWHSKCRNWYTNEKSYKLTEKKNQGRSDAEDLNQPGCSTSSQHSRLTRTNTPTFDAKNACLICNKRWMRGKEPTCRVSSGWLVKDMTWWPIMYHTTSHAWLHSKHIVSPLGNQQNKTCMMLHSSDS